MRALPQPHPTPRSSLEAVGGVPEEPRGNKAIPPLVVLRDGLPPHAVTQPAHMLMLAVVAGSGELDAVLHRPWHGKEGLVHAGAWEAGWARAVEGAKGRNIGRRLGRGGMLS